MSAVIQLHKPDHQWRCRIGRVVVHKKNNVEYLDTVTRFDIEPSRILASALESGMSVAVVIGYDNDGQFYFSSSTADGGNALWLMAIAKRKLLNTAEAMVGMGPAAA